MDLHRSIGASGLACLCRGEVVSERDGWLRLGGTTVQVDKGVAGGVLEGMVNGPPPDVAYPPLVEPAPCTALAGGVEGASVTECGGKQ